MVVERNKSVPIPSFFGLFRSTTVPFKGFKKSRWNIVQLHSWPDLTGGLNRTIRNFFPGTGKPVSRTVRDFAGPVWALSRISLMPASSFDNSIKTYETDNALGPCVYPGKGFKPNLGGQISLEQIVFEQMSLE